MTFCMDVQKKLFSYQDKKYQSFMKKITPNVSNIIGVRMPMIKSIVKYIFKQGFAQKYISFSSYYFEEKMIQSLLIANSVNDLNDFCLIKSFVPKIDNWAVCDAFCTYLKVVLQYPKDSLCLIDEYLLSQNEFEVRFGFVLLLFHFVQKEYLDYIFQKVNLFHHQGYYAKMAVAWLLSICYINYKDETLQYLSVSKLDIDTFNKSIQKMIESQRVPVAEKVFLRQLKRKELK